MKTALECLICKKAESIVMVDDIIQKLNEMFPGVSGFERPNVLKELSKIYGKKVDYMGKKKRYSECFIANFYKHISLTLHMIMFSFYFPF
jgi:hypothetical protein